MLYRGVVFRSLGDSAAADGFSVFVRDERAFESVFEPVVTVIDHEEHFLIARVFVVFHGFDVGGAVSGFSQVVDVVDFEGFCRWHGVSHSVAGCLVLDRFVAAWTDSTTRDNLF